MKMAVTTGLAIVLLQILATSAGVPRLRNIEIELGKSKSKLLFNRIIPL